MNKAVSRIGNFIKICCRRLSSQTPENLVPKNVNIKQDVVYGGDVPSATYRNSFGSLLFSRLMTLRKNNEALQVCEATKLSLSAGDLLKKAVAVARRLQERDVKKGEIVVLIGDNSLNLNAAVTGIFLLGAVPAPISTRTTRDEFRILLKSVRPKIFLIDRRFVQKVKVVLNEDLNQKFELFLLNERQEDENDLNVEPFSEFIRGRGKDIESFKPAEVDNPENELALVMKALTKGSVGRLVGITHHNLNSLIARFDSHNHALLSRHVILMVQRIAWMSGLYSFFVSVCYGAKLIVMSKFDEERLLKAIEEYKVTGAMLFSAKAWLLFKHEYSREYDLSSLKYIITIDGSVPTNLILGIKDKLGINLRPSYGISELTGLVLQSFTASKLGSTGKLAQGLYGKVVSEKTLHKVGPNELGIICFKGPTLTKGYINDKKSTQLLFDKDGFLVSEMFGYYDKEGFFYIVDSVHNVIRHRDCEISPRELEGIIKALDQVRDVAVAGVQHPDDGYWPLAIVVLQPKAKLTAEAIIKHVDGLVEDCKKLRAGVIFIKKIPRSKESGSIKRYLIDKVLSRYRIPARNPLVKSATST